MMTLNSLFAKELRQLLTEEASTWVLTALRQDRLVWECLQDPDFSSQATITLGSDPEQWTLANLSLLALGYEGSLGEALEDADLMAQANTAFESTDAKSRTQEINELGHAALIAFNFLNRTQETGSWDGIPLFFQESPNDIHRLALACLYGFAPEPEYLLQMLLKHENLPEKCKLVLHAVLANPQPIHKQEEMLSALLKDLSINDVNCMLRKLYLQRPEIAVNFARDFVSTHSTPHNGRGFAHITEQVDLLSDLLLHAEINSIAKLPENAISVQTQALQTVHQIKAEIAAQLAGAAVAEGDIDTALTTWQRGGERRTLPRESRTAPPPPELTIALLDGGYPADALALIPEPEIKEFDQTHPSHLIAAAWLAKDEGDTSNAQRFAKQAFQNFVNWSLDTNIEVSVNTYYTRSIIQTNRALVKILSDLSLYPETVFASKIALSYQPNDIDLLTRYAHAQRFTGDPSGAAETLDVAVSLAPNDEHTRRDLITCLEEAEDWDAALLERCELLDDRFAPTPETTWPTREDQYALAKVSLLAEQPERAIAICQDLIQDDEQDGLAHATLGEAFMSLGNTEEALHHLDKATQFSPHQAFSWLALARTLKNADKSEKSLETLRAATHAVPTDPNIFYALAENYLEQDEYSKALPVLQEAHRLVIDQQVDGNPITLNQELITSSQIIPRISLELGKTLQALGHHSEAQHVLSAAYSAYPAYRGLAYSYAKSLLSLDDFASAIPPLVIAVQAEPDELDPNLDYGRALLEAKTQPQEAVRVLTKALEIAPSVPIIKALLAEALMDSGNTEQAMQTYSQVLESDLMDEPEWMGRISHGFGRSALALEKPEIAIASLQEAVRVQPQNPEIFQTLAEAYTTAELTKEALEAAHTAKQLAPDDVEMLTWFANTVFQLEKPGEAIPALTRAIQITPNNTALLIQLGYVQSLAGKDEAAAETYRQIISAENPQSHELLDAAEGLKRLGDFTNAIACLELGLEKLSEPDSDFLKQLALAYKDSKQYERALETLEDAIKLEPESIELLIAKTDVLVLLERPQAAEATLEHAINIHPEYPALHQMMSLFYRTTGQITKALSKAEELVAMHSSASQSAEAFAARALAAELARALLQHEYSISILEDQPAVNTTESPVSDRETINADGYHFTLQAAPYHCLLAEIALERDEEISAANHLTEAVNLAPEHPRVKALQSRLSLRTGDHDFAKQTFQSALEYIDHNKENIKIIDTTAEIDSASLYPDIGKFHEDICTRLAIAEAAVEIKQWEKSVEILELTSTLVPNEPLISALIARTLVLRAEFQDFCHSLDAITNSPGGIALGNEVYQSIKELLNQAESKLELANLERQFDESNMIRRWKIRGNAVFQPNTLNLQSLEELAKNPDDRAALITYISNTKDLSSLSKIYKALKDSSDLKSQHHLVLAQVARSLSNGYRRQEDYEEAMKMMEAAIHQEPSEPLYHALMAEIAFKHDENVVALDSILTALASWPDEPRWHASAAKFNTSQGNITDAIAHLKKAAEIEPNYLPHHLSLGEILQKNGEYRAAIQTFEFALELAPNDLEPDLCLAQAYLSIGEYEKAEGYAQSATRKAPDEIAPLLVSAEIALQTGNLRKAQKNAKSALNISPQHPEALQMQAHVLQALGRTEDALETLDQAIQLTEKPLKLQLERADLISSIQGSKVALENLQDLALEYPEDPAVLYHLAKSLALTEQYEAAIFAAQKALKCNTSPLDPKDLSQIHYLLGQLMRRAGQLDQSIYQLNESIRLTPIYLEPYLELGRAHQERRQHALSLQTYQKAITIAPGDPRPYCQAGLLLKESRDYQGAESMLRRAADLAPDDLSIHRQLGALVALNIVHNRRAVPKA